MIFRRKKKEAAQPRWALGIDSVAWIDDHEEVIDGILVKFTKPGWSWTVLREDLPIANGWLVDSGPAETREEALKIGLEKMRKHQEQYSASTKLGVK